MNFSFHGEISSSKSLFNRALVVQSFLNRIEIQGLTESDDVIHLKKSLQAFNAGDKNFFCGDGGTTFRFLAMRVSRVPGAYKLHGSAQLFSRPMQALFDFFEQVGVGFTLSENTLHINTKGWKVPLTVRSLSNESSQFLSGILLSGWSLPTDLRIEFSSSTPSIGYLDMTIKIMKYFGADIKYTSDGIKSVLLLKANQQPLARSLQLEQDMSSLFTLASCAVADGEININNVSQESLQPDAIFFKYFRKMKINYDLSGNKFYIRKQNNYKNLEADLKNTPDLFPVLAVLVSRAIGVSVLTGLENLKFKESNRYQNTLDLLQRLNRKVEKIPNGVLIHGQSDIFCAEGDFDPQGDHRMVMAGHLANLAGARLRILNKDAINKSFPEFWSIMGEEEA